MSDIWPSVRIASASRLQASGPIHVGGTWLTAERVPAVVRRNLLRDEDPVHGYCSRPSGEKTRVITPSRVWLAMSIGDGEAGVERLCLLLVGTHEPIVQGSGCQASTAQLRSLGRGAFDHFDLRGQRRRSDAEIAYSGSFGAPAYQQVPPTARAFVPRRRVRSWH